MFWVINLLLFFFIPKCIDPLDSADKQLLNDALSEQNADNRMVKLFKASVKILDKDYKAQAVLQKFFESMWSLVR